MLQPAPTLSHTLVGYHKVVYATIWSVKVSLFFLHPEQQRDIHFERSKVFIYKFNLTWGEKVIQWLTSVQGFAKSSFVPIENYTVNA